MKEHRTTPPLPNSYQFRSRNTIERLDFIFARCTGKNTGKSRELFVQVKEDLDILTWKADKQVQALKDQIADQRRMLAALEVF